MNEFRKQKDRWNLQTIIVFIIRFKRIIDNIDNLERKKKHRIRQLNFTCVLLPYLSHIY